MREIRCSPNTLYSTACTCRPTLRKHRMTNISICDGRVIRLWIQEPKKGRPVSEITPRQSWLTSVHLFLQKLNSVGSILFFFYILHYLSFNTDRLNDTLNHFRNSAITPKFIFNLRQSVTYYKKAMP